MCTHFYSCACFINLNGEGFNFQKHRTHVIFMKDNKYNCMYRREYTNSFFLKENFKIWFLPLAV